MTQPGDDPTIAYEQAAEEAVTAGFAEEITAVITALISAWLAAGALDSAAQALDRLRADAVRMLLAIVPSMAGNLAMAVRQGRELGTELSLAEIDESIGPDEIPVIVDRTLDVVVEQIDDRARRRLHDAAELARAMPAELDGVVTIAAKAKLAVSAARSDVRWSANRAVNLGAAGVARGLGWRLLWIGERNACLQCLAYSGLVAEPGQLFPGGLTFDTRPSTAPPIAYPPRHPNCRCRVEPYDGPDAAAEGFSATDPATALRREARRSVLRGFSGYASTPARLRAAEELLKQGAALPPTVIERAQRDVRRGRFNTRKIY